MEFIDLKTMWKDAEQSGIGFKKAYKDHCLKTVDELNEITGGNGYPMVMYDLCNKGSKQTDKEFYEELNRVCDITTEFLKQAFCHRILYAGEFRK